MKIYLAFILLLLGAVGLNSVARRFFKPRWEVWLGYGVPILIVTLFLTTASIPPLVDWFGDFAKAYYPAGVSIIHNPSNLYPVVLDENPFFGFVNIPIIALLFTPFAFFSKRIAVILFLSLGVLTVAFTCYLLIRFTQAVGWRRGAIVGLFAINGPLYHSIWYGNLSHFILLVLLGAVICLENKRDFWVGILLAIAALIKLPLFLLSVYFALRQRWRVLLGIGTALFVIVGISVLLFGFDLHITWWYHIKRFSTNPVSAYNVQSVDGFLVRLLTDTKGELRNFKPVEVGWDFKVMRYALLSLLFGMTFWVCWRSKFPRTTGQQNLEFSIVLCLALLVSPISWTHYYLFLLLPLSLYLGNKLAVPQGRLWLSLAATSVFLISLPTITPEITNFLLKLLYTKFLISHYFLGGALLLGIFLAARWQAAKCSRLPLDKEGLLLSKTD